MATAHHEEYPDRVSGMRKRRELESVKIANMLPQHKIGEVYPGTHESGRLGGVNSNLEPSDATSEEERLRATSNDGDPAASQAGLKAEPAKDDSKTKKNH